MPIQPRTAVVALATATVFGLVVTGCGSSSSGSSATPKSAADAAASIQATVQAGASAASPGSSSGSSAKLLDVCQAMPAATASQITGTKFTKATASTIMGQLSECKYSGPNYTLLYVSVDTEAPSVGVSQPGKFLMDTDVQALNAMGHKPDSVSGVGDAAFHAPAPKGNAGGLGSALTSSFGAVYGDTYIKVSGMYVTAAQGTKIVELVHSKM